MQILVVGARLSSTDDLGEDVVVHHAPTLDDAVELMRTDAYDCTLSARSPAELLGLLGDSVRPLVHVSGDLDAADTIDALGAGADESVPAGANGEELERALARAIVRHRRNSELHETVAELERLATLDPLTGVFNRRGIEGAMKRAVATAQRGATDCHFLVIDLDDFKQINDQHGWAGGDQVLKAVANALVDCVRATDDVGRIGGDEFMVLLPATRMNDAVELGRRIRVALGRLRLSVEGRPVPVQASLGVAHLPVTARTVSDANMQVQAALRRAKLRGKDTVTIADMPAEPIAGATVTESGSWAGPSSRPDRFLIAQPIARLADEAVVGWWLDGPRPAFAVTSEAPDEAFDIVVRDLEELAGASRAASELPGTSPVWFSVLPETIARGAPSRIVGALREGASERPRGLVMHDRDLPNDIGPLLEGASALRALGVELSVREPRFNRTSLEALVLLRPELVAFSAARVRSASGRAKPSREGFRLARIVRGLGALPVMHGVAGPGDLELAGSLQITLGTGSALGQVVVLQRG